MIAARICLTILVVALIAACSGSSTSDDKPDIGSLVSHLPSKRDLSSVDIELLAFDLQRNIISFIEFFSSFVDARMLTAGIDTDLIQEGTEQIDCLEGMGSRTLYAPSQLLFNFARIYSDGERHSSKFEDCALTEFGGFLIFDGDYSLQVQSGLTTGFEFLSETIMSTTYRDFYNIVSANRDEYFYVHGIYTENAGPSTKTIDLLSHFIRVVTRLSFTTNFVIAPTTFELSIEEPYFGSSYVLLTLDNDQMFTIYLPNSDIAVDVVILEALEVDLSVSSSFLGGRIQLESNFGLIDLQFDQDIVIWSIDTTGDGLFDASGTYDYT